MDEAFFANAQEIDGLMIYLHTQDLTEKQLLRVYRDLALANELR